jgi:hypothetical protein
MKRLYVTTFLTLAAASVALAQGEASRQTIPFSDPSRPGTLNVQAAQGPVTVRAYDGKAVTVETMGSSTAGGAAARARTGADAAAIQGLRRIDSYGRNVGVSQKDNTISIQASSNDSSGLLIQVPVRTNLSVNAAASGVTIEGVDGEIEVNATGDVVLTEISGSVLANSNSGKLTASVRRANPDKPMSFVAINGSIDVTLPPDVKASVKARTLDGEIYTGFDANEFALQPFTTSPFPLPFYVGAVTKGPSAPAVAAQLQAQIESASRAAQLAANARITTKGFTVNGGRYLLHTSPFQLDRSAAGTINGGGPDFEFRTLHGDIFIRKRK